MYAMDHLAILMIPHLIFLLARDELKLVALYYHGMCIMKPSSWHFIDLCTENKTIVE
jgi:hypothetical protein